MIEREMPESDHDLLISLWTFMVGTNGNGLIAKFDEFVKTTNDRLDLIEQKMLTMWTREDHECAEKEYQVRDAAKETARRDSFDRRKMSKRETFSSVVAVISTVAAVGATVVAIIALKGVT